MNTITFSNFCGTCVERAREQERAKERARESDSAKERAHVRVRAR